MPTSYRYNFKPKGSGNTRWVTTTRSRSAYRRSSAGNSGFFGDYIAGVLARIVVSLFQGK